VQCHAALRQHGTEAPAAAAIIAAAAAEVLQIHGPCTLTARYSELPVISCSDSRHQSPDMMRTLSDIALGPKRF
jgi:hypothetical protein